MNKGESVLVVVARELFTSILSSDFFTNTFQLVLELALVVRSRSAGIYTMKEREKLGNNGYRWKSIVACRSHVLAGRPSLFPYSGW